MRNKWKDAFTALVLAACTVLFVILSYLGIWYSLPAKQRGYHISEVVVERGRLKYYIVEMVRDHATNRIVYSTANFNDAVQVMTILQTLREVE